MALGQEAFQGANRDWPINFTASAGGLAGVRADPSADARHGIRIARVLIRFFEPSLGDQCDVTAGIGVCGTRHHAGEVCVEPFPVDRLLGEAAKHSPLFDEVNWFPAPRVMACPRGHAFCDLYFESVKSALPVPATSTDLVCGFVPSCQATTLYLPSGTLSIL